ncbi:MAG TPA: flagellar biosynthetic protein FliO [Pyrinomonadaceae bacterium]
MAPGLHIINAAAFVFRQEDGGAFRAQTGTADFLLMLLQTVFALALVCGLAYVIFRVVLPRLNVTRSTGSMVRIVDRVGLDARKSLYVIEVAGRWFLVSASEAGVQLVSELDAESALLAEQEAEAARPTFGAPARAASRAFAERLARLMNKKGNGR